MKMPVLSALVLIFFVACWTAPPSKAPENSVVPAPGVQGVRGQVGPKGEQGIQGIRGLAGINGTNGISGTNGTNGKDGTNGTNGTKGDKGDKGDNAAQDTLRYVLIAPGAIVSYPAVVAGDTLYLRAKEDGSEDYAVAQSFTYAIITDKPVKELSEFVYYTSPNCAGTPYADVPAGDKRVVTNSASNLGFAPNSTLIAGTITPVKVGSYRYDGGECSTNGNWTDNLAPLLPAALPNAHKAARFVLTMSNR